jgi:crotonobetaine/carnitine-CoA ligase
MTPGLPEPATIRDLILAGARRWPQRTLVSFEDGTSWTWARARDEAARAAGVLTRHGVGRHDRVLIMLPNGADWLRAWWGAALLDAVIVPLNPAYRGRLLAELLVAAPGVVVTDEERRGRLPEGTPALDPSALRSGPAAVPEPDEPAGVWDVHMVLFTSGTTGPSKGSMNTHLFFNFVQEWLVTEVGVGPEDVFLADLPLFHLSALGPITLMLRVGGAFALRTAPRLDGYWSVARATGATFAVVVATAVDMLRAAPPSLADTDHRLRFLYCVPTPANGLDFMARFGVSRLVTCYGSTEANLPVASAEVPDLPPGSCGRVRAGFELRIVDDHDIELPAGTIGEAIIRCEHPWVMSTGYLGSPEATVAGWRNGWFHTGDLMRMDERGHLYFHDRTKDCLRRRGENISSFEVEREVLSHPDVLEAACVAAREPGADDDEVKVFVVPSPAAEIDFAELVRYLVPRTPHFMIPRYFEVIEALPKTPSHRVQKHLLRERGHSPATWDRDAAGLRVTRNGLVEDRVS